MRIHTVDHSSSTEQEDSRDHPRVTKSVTPRGRFVNPFRDFL
jgi:hypothetical protein